MTGKAGQRSNKRTTLPKRYRPEWLKKGDGRTVAYRFVHARLAELAEQYGGPDQVTPIERSLLERLVHIEFRVVAIEDRMRSGKPVDAPSYLALVDRLHGMSKTLGLQRRAKKVVGLHEYMQGKTGGDK